MELEGIMVGLGNPGIKYQNTKHNLGFLALEQFLESISKEYKLEKVSNKFNCLLFRVDFGKKTWLFAFPQTFMNLSGESVQPLLSWYKINHEKLYIVHDELDLPPGKIQLKKGGGIAGHNGLKSISERLSTNDYYRLRIGIGRPSDPSMLSSYVLSGFYDVEEETKKSINDTCLAIINIIKNGPVKAGNEINRRKKENI